MTDNVFTNPDLGILYHKLTQLNAQSMDALKEIISEIRVEQGVTESRMSAAEEAIKEVRETHRVFTDLASSIAVNNQRSDEIRGDYKQILGKLDGLATTVAELSHSRQSAAEAMAEIKEKVNHLVDSQSKFDASKTAIIKELDSVTKSVKELQENEEEIRDYLASTQGAIRMVGWIGAAFGAIVLALASWFANIVMEDHQFISENRKAIGTLQEHMEQHGLSDPHKGDQQ